MNQRGRCWLANVPHPHSLHFPRYFAKICHHFRHLTSKCIVNSAAVCFSSIPVLFSCFLAVQSVHLTAILTTNGTLNDPLCRVWESWKVEYVCAPFPFFLSLPPKSPFRILLKFLKRERGGGKEGGREGICCCRIISVPLLRQNYNTIFCSTNFKMYYLSISGKFHPSFA